MSHEVDAMVFVGEQSGDAFAVRWGTTDGSRFLSQRVVVIDGGFRETGSQLVEHIRTYYDTDKIDLVISTHPDADHVNGLAVVLEEMTIAHLAMHLPWSHTQDIASMFRDGRVTDESISGHLRASLQSARDLETLALERGVPITEPFAGVSLLGGEVTFAGPSIEHYENLLPGFRGTPEPVEPAGVLSRAAGVLRRVMESFGRETLTDEGETSPENQSSAITVVEASPHKLLFTGDAGIEALTAAADTLGLDGTTASGFSLIQVPHHGSRHNVGPTVLDRIVGPRLATDTQLATAIVSAATNGAPRHPAKQVTNAFRRRGAHVIGAHQSGNKVCSSSDGTPPRPGWIPIDPLPMYDEVEDD